MCVCMYVCILHVCVHACTHAFTRGSMCSAEASGARGDWLTTDIVVHIRRDNPPDQDCADTNVIVKHITVSPSVLYMQIRHKFGFRRGVATLYSPELDKHLSVGADSFGARAPPEQDDKVVYCTKFFSKMFPTVDTYMQVKLIHGEEREMVGTLLSIDGLEGVVKTDTHDIKLYHLSSLCKLFEEYDEEN